MHDFHAYATTKLILQYFFPFYGQMCLLHPFRLPINTHSLRILPQGQPPYSLAPRELSICRPHFPHKVFQKATHYRR